MADTINRAYRRSIHPLHAILLAGTVPLCFGVLISDIAYAATYEVQWKNFASWLIVGSLVFGGFAQLWAFIGLFSLNQSRREAIVCFVLLLVAWVIGFINALIHAKDAWASMPEGLVLSVAATVLTIAATWVTFSTFRTAGLA